MMERTVINGREYLVYEVHEGTAVDQIGVSMLEHNQVHGLMKFKYVHEEDRDYFRYDVGCEESLAEWLLQIRYKEEVITMINSILAVYEEVPVYLLREDNLLTEITQISIVGGKCLFAYVPSEDIKGDCVSLVQRILSRIKYPLDEDYSYIFDLQNAYGRGEIKNIADIHKWIRIVTGELEDPSNDGYEDMQKERDSSFAGYEIEKESAPELKVAAPQAAESKITASKETAPTGTAQEKNDAINDIFAEFGIPVSTKAPEKPKKEKSVKAEKVKPEKEKKSGIHLFGKKKEEPKAEASSMQMQVQQNNVAPKSPMVINDLNRGNRTVLMDAFGDNASSGLVRDKNRQEYIIRTGESIIGSGKDADIMINDNSAISRKHARLFISNGDYYIEDLGSTNGTCVNGEVLVPHVPCLIKDMAHIKISNETFTFRVGR